MAPRYEIDHLLRLRDSSLCVKPKDLAPIDEWIGPAVEDRSRRSQISTRGQRDSANFGNGITVSKGASQELARHGRQGSGGDSNSKNTFSAGNLEAEKTFASPTRGNFGLVSSRTDQSIGMGRFGLGEREQAQNRDHRGTTRSTNLRSSKEDGESWFSSKLARRPEAEDGERGNTRRGDRDHNQNQNRENGRDHHKRHGGEIAGEGVRSKDWRSGDKNTSRMGREWQATQEQDPEWMAEENFGQEPKKYTADDFEAWKKSMKAQQAAVNGNIASTDPAEEVGSPVPAVVSKKVIDTPLVLDGAEDKFFGLWASTGTVQKKEIEVVGTLAPLGNSKLGKSSKFTGFFASEAPIGLTSSSASSPPPVSPAVRSPTTTEDQQGIARILEMLKNKPNANASPLLLRKSKIQTPPPEENVTSATPPLVSPRPKPHGVQNFLNPQSPAPDANSQFLLNLMRSKEGGQGPKSPFSQQSRGLGGPPSASFPGQYDRLSEAHNRPELLPIFDKLNPSSNVSSQQRHHGRDNSRSYDEPSAAVRQQHGPPPGFLPGFPHNQNMQSYPPGLGPPPNGQAPVFQNQRGPVGLPPGFGQPIAFRSETNYPPGFGIPQQMATMSIGEPGPGMPPGFSGSPGFGRPPPGFQDRSGPVGMPMDRYREMQRDERGLYGPRD